MIIFWAQSEMKYEKTNGFLLNSGDETCVQCIHTVYQYAILVHSLSVFFSSRSRSNAYIRCMFGIFFSSSSLSNRAKWSRFTIIIFFFFVRKTFSIWKYFIDYERASIFWILNSFEHKQWQWTPGIKAFLFRGNGEKKEFMPTPIFSWLWAVAAAATPNKSGWLSFLFIWGWIFTSLLLSSTFSIIKLNRSRKWNIHSEKWQVHVLVAGDDSAHFILHSILICQYWLH